MVVNDTVRVINEKHLFYNKKGKVVEVYKDELSILFNYIKMNLNSKEVKKV